MSMAQLEEWKETVLIQMELLLRDRSDELLHTKLEAAKNQIGQLCYGLWRTNCLERRAGSKAFFGEGSGRDESDHVPRHRQNIWAEKSLLKLGCSKRSPLQKSPRLQSKGKKAKS